MAENGSYKINIDGKWSLDDLYVFPRAFEQSYYAYEAVLGSLDQESEERIHRAFASYPWRGGYSAVNFYNQLKYITPKAQRPYILSIQYASPGWIELFLNVPLAYQVCGVVTAVAGTIGACNKVYNNIYSDLQRRRLLRIEAERREILLGKEEIEYISYASEKMSGILNLPSADIIHHRTNNKLVSIKILLSIYRRIRKLSEYKHKNKAEFLPKSNDLDRS